MVGKSTTSSVIAIARDILSVYGCLFLSWPGHNDTLEHTDTAKKLHGACVASPARFVHGRVIRGDQVLVPCTLRDGVIGKD